MKPEVSSVPNTDKPRKRKGLGCIGVGLLAWFLLAIGIAFGVLVFPYVRTWLEDHEFIGTLEETGETSDATRTIISEENWVTEVVNKVKDGVVSIAVAEVGLNSDTGEIEESVNIGTGFIIDSSGLIMTNQHVVSDEEADYVVVTSEGSEYDVEEVSRDDINDVAILKVSSIDLQPLTLGDSSDLVVGQYVVAIGTPLGNFPGSVTTGIISGLGRSVTASSGGFWGSSRIYENVLQTDAAINPGNSGGPLLDSDGNVIGINFATTSGADNISFAIPINNVKDRIAEYHEYGKFIKPYLGVEYQLISTTEALFYDDVMPGALVTSVLKDSPAAAAGIKRADIIIKINDENVSSSFSSMIQKYEVGEKIDLTIWRSGKKLNLEATLEAVD